MSFFNFKKNKKWIPFKQKRAAHLVLGQKGEDLACRLLEELGIVILARNYHSEHGEVDIVARDEDILCFIEVKTRSNNYLFEPRDAVNSYKRKRIIFTSLNYLKFLPGNRHPRVRYDIIEVIRRGKTFEIIRYWRQAYK